ncbi:alpha,alpha-trehalase TreF [Daejeonella oryzae]|uniref:alpha,alpha-trehalase TreF n=1 Tax=Daejeonella oryzae TaxID=1122943 RepID=UPI0004150802|nr:alpha,alpha-trehalase TreF [Daejeonella oryzae]
MRKLTLFLLFIFIGSELFSQTVKTPDEIYGELFRDVQMQQVFSDGKSFVDCVPRRDPSAIMADYRKIKANPAVKFSLKLFIDSNFTLPANPVNAYKSDTSKSVKYHIEHLWELLQRKPDIAIEGSSLLALPNPYLVPGGRFREIYYWDSYFTMLGLQESKEIMLMENMVKNFAYLIDTYGHIPNGNRSYYVSRSQPPFFSLMVGLLAESKGDSIYQTYLPALEKEYEYWMNADEGKLKSNSADRSVVELNGFTMNRYWDELEIPRQESYREDSLTARESGRNVQEMYRHLRSGAASGWDFSSRWFADSKEIKTIQTADIIPVDLVSLLYGLEQTLYTTYLKNADTKKAAIFKSRLNKRIEFLNTYCWNNEDGLYYDYNFRTKKQVKIPSLATTYPLFFKMASAEQAKKVAGNIRSKFLKSGGLTTTLNNTGQQWDAPNGWAPLQWMTIQGLENYRQHDLAKDIAERWTSLNIKVFHRTGKLMEKYNVMDTNLEAGGGEYPSQDGFGWTNGVLLKLMNKYKLPD